MLARTLLVVVLALVFAGCRDKQLDLQRSTLVRELATAKTASDAASAACKSLTSTPVALTSPLEERRLELDAKVNKSALEIQEDFMLRGMLISRRSAVIAALDKCAVDLKTAEEKATEVEAKIADIDKLQPPG